MNTFISHLTDNIVHLWWAFIITSYYTTSKGCCDFQNIPFKMIYITPTFNKFSSILSQQHHQNLENLSTYKNLIILCITQIYLITLLPSLIARRWVGRQTQSRHKAIYSSWLGPELFCLLLDHRGSTVGFLLLQCSSGVVRHPRDLQVSVATRCFCRPHLCFNHSIYP